MMDWPLVDASLGLEMDVGLSSLVTYLISPSIHLVLFQLVLEQETTGTREGHDIQGKVMTNAELVDELTHLKTQFADSIDNLIKKLSSESTTSSIMTKLLTTRREAEKQPTLTKEEAELKRWFDRPEATANEPKSWHRFWGRYPSVKEAFEHPESDSFKLLSQLNRAFYGIAWHILKDGRKNNETTKNIVEKVIWEANIFFDCVCLETFCGIDEKLEFKFIKNVKNIVAKIENGTMN